MPHLAIVVTGDDVQMPEKKTGHCACCGADTFMRHTVVDCIVELRTRLDQLHTRLDAPAPTKELTRRRRKA